MKDIHDDELRFGDEIECGIFAVDSGKKTIQISTRSAEVRVGLLNYRSILNIATCFKASIAADRQRVFVCARERGLHMASRVWSVDD